MRTQVLIIGAGPAGLLLSQLLHKAGIESVVLERKSREHVEGRIRAGVLEQGTVDLLRQAGAAARLERQALVHDGIEIAKSGERQKINFKKLAGKSITIYGQTEVTRDLGRARDEAGGDLRYEVEKVALHDLESARPWASYVKDGREHRIEADFIAGCDGFHGVSRQSIPKERLVIFERVYPFAWLGILSAVPPPAEDLIYAQHERGFALCSMRSKSLSRHYLQCHPEENLDDWPEERIWEEVALRIGDARYKTLVRGPLLEKSLTPMRSFVCETMRHGSLFLAGDAAHIMPPTGAKGLNLAASDVHYLSQGLIEHYRQGSDKGLDHYAGRALARVWKAQRFSWWMTSMLHNFGPSEEFQNRIHRAELSYVLSSQAAQTALAENYVGLPF
jgi:p-hydroxybenzoate 3-monooxygenase